MAIDNKTLYFAFPLRSSSYSEKLAALRYEAQHSCMIIEGFAKILKRDLLKKNRQDEIITAILSDLEVISTEVTSYVTTMHNFKSSSTSEKNAEIVFKKEFPALITKIKDLANKTRTALTLAHTYLPETEEWENIFAHVTDPIETLIEILTNPDIKPPQHILDWLQARDKIVTLANAKDSQCVFPLLAALANPEPFIRVEVIDLLRNIKDARSVEPLIQALKDDNWEVRVTAVEALATVGDERATEPLFTILTQELAHPTNSNGAGRMIDSLCRTLKAVSGPSLKNIQEQCINLLLANIQEPDRAMQNGAAWGFRSFPDTRAIPLLISALRASPKPSFMWGFTSALEAIGGAEAEEALRLYGK